MVAANMARDIGFPDPTGQWLYFRASITGEFLLRENCSQSSLSGRIGNNSL